MSSSQHGSQRDGSTRPSVLVTGGTGTIGSVVVDRLVASGRGVRTLARSASPHPVAEHRTGDLSTGAGVDDAVTDVDTIVHCAGGAAGDDAKARVLVDAIRRTGGRPHVVLISVVGADVMPIVSRVDRTLFGYFDAKLGAERAIIGSGLPWTILRSTQTHELTLQTFRLLSKAPVTPVFAGVHLQPIAAVEVGERLADLSLGEAMGSVPDVGGPEVLPMRDLAVGALRHLRKRRPVLSISLPGGAARAYRGGANLAPLHATGVQTWEGFLAAQGSERAGDAR